MPHQDDLSLPGWGSVLTRAENISDCDFNFEIVLDPILDPRSRRLIPLSQVVPYVV
jgi:hypothetical protein